MIRPQGGRISGNPCGPKLGLPAASPGVGGAAVCTASLGAPGCAPNAATYAMSVRFGSPFWSATASAFVTDDTYRCPVSGSNAPPGQLAPPV